MKKMSSVVGTTNVESVSDDVAPDSVERATLAKNKRWVQRFMHKTRKAYREGRLSPLQIRDLMESGLYLKIRPKRTKGNTQLAKAVRHGNNDKTISDNVSGDTKSDKQHGGYVARTAQQSKTRKKASMAKAREKSAASNVEQMFKDVTYKANSGVEIWLKDGKRVKVTISFIPIDGKNEVYVALASWRNKQKERNDGWRTESGIGVGTADEAYENLRTKLFDTFSECIG